jgi:hypothetical protein
MKENSVRGGNVDVSYHAMGKNAIFFREGEEIQ